MLSPGDLVQGVVEVAGRCNPTASHGAYDVDQAQIKLYLSIAGNVEGVVDYLEHCVTGVTEDEYLDKAAPRLAELRHGDGCKVRCPLRTEELRWRQPVAPGRAC